MKIALFDAFPASAFTAEREFIRRCINTLTRMGHEAKSVCLSDQVVAYDPDFVLVTHDFVPKLTSHFTVGTLWSPTSFFAADTQRMRNIQSWDLILPINEELRNLALDLHFPLRDGSSVSPRDFFPTAPLQRTSLPDTSRLSLVYVGVHWDGARHQRLFEELADVVDLNVYGPEKAWSYLPSAYRGPVPFDGKSLVDVLNRHGAVLALHKSAHRSENTPSMRVFEACAAKCLVITDPMPSLQSIFGDSLAYVDADLHPKKVAQQVHDIMSGARRNPKEAQERIQTASDIFATNLSLERQMKALIVEVEDLKRKPALVKTERPSVSVIIRCGSRPISMVKRAITSVANQSYRDIVIILVVFAPIDGLEAYVGDLNNQHRFSEIKIVTPEGRLRSTTMWAGLKAVETPFFKLLDDDDELFPTHLSDTMEFFARHPHIDFAYCGSVKWEETGVLENQPLRLSGDTKEVFEETRELAAFEDYDLDKVLQFKNPIMSPCWLARSDLLTDEVLVDPRLDSVEDVYLFLLLKSRGARFGFTGRVGASWNFRTASRDNSMLSLDDEFRQRCVQRIRTRLSALPFAASYLGRDVVNTGYADFKRDAAPPLLYFPEDYVASLDDGIDFKIDGNPSFLKAMSGLSYWEGWGRWSETSEVRLTFKEALPDEFTFRIRCYASPANAELSCKVSVGDLSSSFQASLDMNEYDMLFRDVQGAKLILINIPNATPPLRPDGTVADSRHLGLAIESIKVLSVDAFRATGIPAPALPVWPPIGQATSGASAGVPVPALPVSPAEKVGVADLSDVDALDMVDASASLDRVLSMGEVLAFDLREPALPDFVSSVEGWSVVEDWGRWTLGDASRVIVKPILHGTIEVELSCLVTLPNRYVDIVVVVGGSVQAFSIREGILHTIRLQFKDVKAAKTIKFLIPNAISPRLYMAGASIDARRIGLGLQTLTIRKI